ncbi:B-cell receptor CD22 isoform X2 [Ictalurus punctatus]|uniref:B-cell receptor CD22 isoform X2 n=1 Tax=Ictalurus punctatus TaxID=7998 RepID=A0A9F7RBS9_ICTPU|nr:B-cell receptor CD22 isoform X2 [Ictalurus punctatus]
MMSPKLTPPLSLLFLLKVSGVLSQPGLGVSYTQSNICALRGSTVTMGCRYTYPDGYRVQRVFWSRELVTDKEPPDLSSDPKYTGRVQYLGDKRSNCSLRLSDVTEQDRGKYYFRFITTTSGGRYQGTDGVDLSVARLQLEMIPVSVVEGDEVTLTCKTTCSLTDTPAFTWHKNLRPLFSVNSSNLLRLPSVSQMDAGDYRCGVQGQIYHSPAVTLDVQYPPKNVSVSISPSGEIVEGSSVTLTCSSDANPPVEYTWFKGTSFKIKGKTYTLNKISSEDSGDYKCKSSNQHGEKYSETTVNVLYPPKNVSVSISPSGEIVEGSVVTLSCSSDANPPVDYTWFKGTSFKIKGKTYTVNQISSEDSGDYKCKSSNQHGEKYSETTVNVLYPPKDVSVSISPSGEIVEGSVVTLTCSSDANPPVETYTWYKVDESSPVGSGQSYSFPLSSNSSGWFYCVAQNKFGSQSAAAVPLTSSGGRSVVLYVILGVTVGCGCLLAIIGVLCMRSKRRGGSINDTKVSSSSQINNPSPPEDPYTALDLQTKSSNDVYDTLATVHPSPPEDPYTALDSQSISPDYDTLTVSSSVCSSLHCNHWI